MVSRGLFTALSMSSKLKHLSFTLIGITAKANLQTWNPLVECQLETLQAMFQ